MSNLQRQRLETERRQLMKRCTNQTSVCFIEIHQGKCDGYNLYDGLLCEHWQEPPAQMPQPGHGLIVPQGTLETKTGSNSKTAEIEPQPMPLIEHTPLPWRACNDGECSCLQIWCKDHPIAEVISGDWGDDYPSIRLVGESSLDLKAEAYLEADCKCRYMKGRRFLPQRRKSWCLGQYGRGQSKSGRPPPSGEPVAIACSGRWAIALILKPVPNVSADIGRLSAFW